MELVTIRLKLDPNKAATDTGAGMMQKTANEVYTADYTGTITATKRDFDNLSGFVRFNKNLNHGKSYISSKYQ